MNARRVMSTILVSLGACVGGLLFSSAPALAARGHVFSGAFGSKGAAAGQLNEPAGVAVNEASGDVYVVDRGNDRVEYFTSAGVYAGAFDGSGANVAVEGKAAPSGRFSEPESIAIDNEAGSPSFGDVYVADAGHSVIDKFSASGEYLGQLTESSVGSTFGFIRGLAMDAKGKLWVCQQEKEIDAFSNALTNEFISKITSTGLPFNQIGCGFAVDSNEDLYGESGFTGIGKLNSSGQVLILEFDSLLHEFFGVTLGKVAVDLSNNEVYIDNADGENSVGRFSAAGKFVETFGSEHLTNGGGIAVDAATGDVYVADATADDVNVFALEPEARPTIESEGPSAVTATSATLSAQLKPTGPDTTYYFQYGTVSCAASPSACTDLPAPPGVDIGSGFAGQGVSVHLQDLQSDTSYRFRVVAVNALGTSDGTEQTFTTQTVGGEFALADGRLWEMVTPPEKHGSDLIAVGNEQGAAIQAAADGSAITYGATSPFAANPAGSRSPEVTQIFSARDAPGAWTTADITTPHTEGAAGLAVGSAAEYKLFSSDLSAGLVEPTGDTPLPPLPPNAEKTIYLRMRNGEYKALVTSANIPPGTKLGGEDIGGGAEFISATPDLSHIVLGSSLQLTPTPVGAGRHLYEWTAGQLQLVSVLPDEEPVAASLGDRGERTNGNVRNAISTDGSQLVFEAGGHYYLRNVTREKTVQVDAAQGAPEPSGSSSEYQTANSEDSRVFFTSSQQLTASSTASSEGGDADLYEFETTNSASEPPAGRLTDLTVAAHAGEHADVRGVIGASEDGSYVYFVANGVLGDGAEHGARQGTCERRSEKFKETCNLYVEHYDAATGGWTPPTFIAALSGADSPSWGAHGPNLKALTARVSPNGRYLAFMSERSLTGYENRDANSGKPDEEVYLYDAAAAHLVCASCNPTGAQPAGLLEGGAYESNLVDYAQNWQGRWLAGNVPGWTTKDLSSAIYQSRYLSNSGRLFFNSADALVPADVNGKEDVYEYEPTAVGSCQGVGQSASDVFDAAAGGCLSLISAGTSTEESAFMDASESGGDVFFITESRLSPQDFDTSLDLYDAHECTTTSPCAPPAALAPPPCTTGDACKAAPTPQPAIFGAPSSETFSGAGNVAQSTPGASAVTPRSTTRGQKLVKALKKCRKKPKRRRAACERQARKRYGASKGSAGKSKSAQTRR
jgi:DNA-binding beta-propeller fold protein YncE